MGKGRWMFATMKPHCLHILRGAAGHDVCWCSGFLRSRAMEQGCAKVRFSPTSMQRWTPKASRHQSRGPRIEPGGPFHKFEILDPLAGRGSFTACVMDTRRGLERLNRSIPYCKPGTRLFCLLHFSTLQRMCCMQEAMKWRAESWIFQGSSAHAGSRPVYGAMTAQKRQRAIGYGI